MALNPHIATKFWVEQGEFPTAKNFVHYDLSAHFKEKQRLAEEAEAASRLKKNPMYNDMFLAVLSGKVSEVKRIIDLGGDITAKDMVGMLDVAVSTAITNCMSRAAQNNWTTLHHAAKGGHALVVDFLLSQNVSLSAKTNVCDPHPTRAYLLSLLGLLSCASRKGRRR